MFNKILCSALAATLALPIQIADAQCFDRWGNPTACPVDAAPARTVTRTGLFGRTVTRTVAAPAPVVRSYRYATPTYSYQSGGSSGTVSTYQSGGSSGEVFAHWGPMTASEAAVSARYGTRTVTEPAGVSSSAPAGSAACNCERCDRLEQELEKAKADIEQIKRQLGIRAEVDAAIKDSLSHRGPTVSRHAGPSVVLTSHRGPSVVISPPSDPGYSVAMR